MASVYRLENVVKTFALGKRRATVLHEINLSIEEGEYVAIVGPSGSGKSTLLNLLGCLDTPSSGNMQVLGQEVGSLDDDALAGFRASRLGFVFQSFHLLPAYDAASNVMLGGVYSRVGDRRQRALSLLKGVGLSERAHYKPALLSGGEKQRVAIARALMNRPKILLADEPTGALDQRTGLEILALIESLHKKGMTTVLITHDPNVAKRARRIVQVQDGRVVRTLRGGHA